MKQFNVFRLLINIRWTLNMNNSTISDSQTTIHGGNMGYLIISRYTHSMANFMCPD